MLTTATLRLASRTSVRVGAIVPVLSGYPTRLSDSDTFRLMSLGPPGPSLEDVTRLVVVELATVLAVDLTNLMRQLEEAGEPWPFDSIVLAEVLVRVEQLMSVAVPMNEATARALRSVRGLAARIHGAVGSVKSA